MAEPFDVVVAGAGPAGSVTALLLARQGCSVAICDRSNPSAFCIGETLPQGASQLIERLQLWDAFEAQAHTPAPGIMSAWGDGDPWVNDFIFSPLGCGWHLDRVKFNQLLVEAASRAGAKIFPGAKVVGCTAQGDGWRVIVAGSPEVREIQSRFLVDGSGRTAAGALGLPRRAVADRLIAVAGLGEPASRASETAYTLVEAVDEGWFYSVLLPCRKYVVAYMTDADLYSAGRRYSERFLETQLEKAPHTRERLRKPPAMSAVFPAFTSVRDSAAGRNWLAVGDAARSYDPLSGLGIYTSMDMATQAARVTVRVLEGDGTASGEYDRLNQEMFARCEESRHAYYSLEQRWPESAFWQRRQARTVI
jgi:flavin-dependent dehydrogenase